MIVTYGRFGVYATLALVVNVLMILGIMAVVNATLTLPGIAGFVLTIGAAVDANVLINERIREEARRGRRVVAAVEIGYKEASRAIFDANITNVIAAVLMFVFGSGPIKGFAVVLMIGIVTSVFTAVTLTRMWVAGGCASAPRATQDLREGQMKLLKLVPDNTNIDFLKLRIPFFVLSLVLIFGSWTLVGGERPQSRASISSAVRWSG